MKAPRTLSHRSANPACSVGFSTQGGGGVEPSRIGRVRPVTNWLNYSGGFPPSYEQYRDMLEEDE